MTARILAPLVLSLLCLPAAAACDISFADPSKFADIGAADEVDRNVGELQKYLQSLCDKKLPQGANLQLQVLDVDLAGDRRLRAAGQWVRVMNGKADWPIVRVKYSVERAGQPPHEATELISDPLYLERGRSISDDPLRYEKRMLSVWFQQRIVEGKAPPAPRKKK
jgi:hypothetical protein